MSEPTPNRNGPRPAGVSRKKWEAWKRQAKGYRVHGVLLEPAGAAPYPSAGQPDTYGKHAVERQFRRAQRNQARIIASSGADRMNIFQYAIARNARQFADRINRGDTLTPQEREAAHIAIAWTMRHPDFDQVPQGQAIEDAAASDQLADFWSRPRPRPVVCL